MSKTVISLQGGGLRFNPMDVALRQETGKHTIALVTTVADIATPVSQRTTLPEGMPVTLTWGTTPARTTTWYGYLHHPESISVPGRAPTVRYVLTGTSAVLGDHTSRTWKSASGSYVVRQLGAAAGFSVYCHKTPGGATFLAQAAESDFTFLGGLADEYGFTLWADCDRLLFLNNRTLLAGPASSSMPAARMDRRNGRQDSLLTFTETRGPTVPGSGQVANRTTFGLDRASGQIIKAASTTDQVASPRRLIDTSRPIGSYSDAVSSLSASTARNDQWITAEAEMLGDIRLQPGGLVWLDGLAMPAGSRGMWLVQRAEHLLSVMADSYTTRLRLTRNAVGQQVFSQILPYGPDNAPQACVLDDTGHWRAALVKEVTYG